jgi:parvulin-like peptidyl-prolyl isomerase
MAGQLPTEIDQILPNLQNGQISDPVRVGSSYAIILVRERRAITEATLPSRDQILQRIGTERLDRAQRRMYQDLRSAAFIENRV